MVMGYREYPALAEKYHVPMALTGFEPLDIVQRILTTVCALEEGRIQVENAYAHALTFEENCLAEAMIDLFFCGVRP